MTDISPIGVAVMHITLYEPTVAVHPRNPHYRTTHGYRCPAIQFWRHLFGRRLLTSAETREEGLLFRLGRSLLEPDVTLGQLVQDLFLSVEVSESDEECDTTNSSKTEREEILQ